jgi:CRP/FNR family cyclic AMP-dependent transcriptional regulator
MQPDSELLKDVGLFQFLDDTERAGLAAQLQIVHFKAGETLFQIGEPGDALYVIRKGAVEAFFKNDTGERITLETVTAGGFIGELSLLDRGPRSANVVAVKDTEALRLDRQNLETFLGLQPQAAMDLLAAMGKRMRFTADRLRHTATRNANEEVLDHRTLVQKSADWIAEFAGSITFLMIHVVWFGIWLTLNSVRFPGIPQWDRFPFGFLTLAVSLEAIFLSVFVLLSQNRQAAKDRVRSDIEYDVNLKAELEIQHLHEKMDRLTSEMLRHMEELHRDTRILKQDRSQTLPPTPPAPTTR